MISQQLHRILVISLVTILSFQRNPHAEANCKEYKGFVKNAKVDRVPFTAKQLGEARKAGLERHNYYRKLHGAPPLVLDKDANNRAQHAAECNALLGKMQHHRSGGDGENLKGGLWGGAPNPKGPQHNITQRAIDAVDSWYSEYCKTDKWPRNGLGHWTQVLWKSSKKLGMGFVESEGRNHLFIAGRYNPAGNSAKQQKSKVGKLNIPENKMCCAKTKQLLKGSKC